MFCCAEMSFLCLAVHSNVMFKEILSSMCGDFSLQIIVCLFYIVNINSIACLIRS